MADAAHPVRAWRAYRSLAEHALADAAGLNRPSLSPIEGGKRTGTAATLGKLAAALGVPLGVPLRVPPGALLAGAARTACTPISVPFSRRSSGWI